METSITYRWWKDNDETDDAINPEHEERLEYAVYERIYECQQQGYHSGELLEEIDGIRYIGWFKKSTPA